MPFSEWNSFPRYSVALCAALLLAALPAVAKPKAAPVQTANIINTGSTNTKGYELRVSSNGSLIRVYTTDDGPAGINVAAGFVVVKQPPIAAKDTRKFFRDLNAAMPLTSLPVRHGMRSASFGTETYVTYKGQTSPDLTFASDPRTAALKADIDAITKTLHLGNAPRCPTVIRSDR